MNGLPPEAAIWRVEGQQWTVRDELMAILVERVDHWGLAQAHIHSTGKGLPSKSIEIPRPGAVRQQEREDRDKVITDPKVIAQFFG